VQDCETGERLFAGGVAGPKVAINYTGLIEAPKNVRCEEITGHSAVVVWNRGRCVRECFPFQDVPPHLQWLKATASLGGGGFTTASVRRV